MGCLGDVERGKILALRADDCGRLGLAARSVGIRLGPGLVASQRAEPKRRSFRPRRKAINDRSFGKAVKRKAESGRIRFYDEPVAEMRLRTPDRHPLRGRPVGRGL